MQDYFRVSWQDFQADTRALLPSLAALKKEWKGIIAVTRGGLVPAAILAHDLDIRLVETVCLTSYDDQAQQGALNILKEFVGDGQDMILIDDLVDSGKTFKHLRTTIPRATYGAVYAKPAGLSTADIFARPLAQETWIIFPWEE